MELLFTGGRVLTIDPLDRIASGVAVRDGRIVAVGDSDEARAAVGPDAVHVDLRGRALVPGFCDPHNHFSMTTFEPRSVDCREGSLQLPRGVGISGPIRPHYASVSCIIPLTRPPDRPPTPTQVSTRVNRP